MRKQMVILNLCVQQVHFSLFIHSVNNNLGVLQALIIVLVDTSLALVELFVFSLQKKKYSFILFRRERGLGL